MLFLAGIGVIGPLFNPKISGMGQIARMLRFTSHAHASTSARLTRHAAGRRHLPPCRVTNTSDEIYKAMDMKQQKDDEDEVITVYDTQVLYPELGSLENRVSKFYLDELFANTGPDLEETAYWFHTPDGGRPCACMHVNARISMTLACMHNAEGWKREPTLLTSAKEAPVTFADPSHETWEAEGRVSLPAARVSAYVSLAPCFNADRILHTSMLADPCGPA